jgi:division protein CdvB (Snf7/Vps24/ESCRT-III family)
MILFSKVRKFLLSIGMVVFISSAIIFSLASGEGINPAQTQIAIMNQTKEMINNVKDQAQEAIANITDDLKTDVVQNDQQFDANTQQGIVDSIKNPDYNPGGKSKEAAKQDREAIKGVEADVRDLFKPE